MRMEEEQGRKRADGFIGQRTVERAQVDDHIHPTPAGGQVVDYRGALCLRPGSKG